MAVRSSNRGQGARRSATSKTRSAPAKQQKAAPARPSRDVTQYAEKPPTAYHKAFARWIISEVGFDPKSVSPMRAFLMGVSIATAARPAYNASDAYEEFRENSGEAKRGPKPRTEAAPARRRRPEPEPEEDLDEDEEDLDDDEDFDDDDSDEDFDDDSDDDESDDDEDFDDEEDEPVPAPVKRGPGRPRKAAPPAAKPTQRAARSGTAAKKAAPAGRGKPKPADDDDFIF